MPQITRSWLAFAAMGAGMIHLALAPGFGVPGAVAPVVLGAAEFGWGVAMLARDRFVVIRLTRVAAFVPAIGWGILLLVAVALQAPTLASILPVLPMAVATLFTLVIAAALSARMRHPSVRSDRPVGAYRYLAALMAGGLLVSALTTSALAAPQAGIDNPHANHGELDISNEHSGH